LATSLKAHPATYRAIDGAISFEVMVGMDNLKDAVTSRERKAISSKSKYSAIAGKLCDGAKNNSGGMNPFLVFSVLIYE
jgi:hypothetical protein